MTQNWYYTSNMVNIHYIPQEWRGWELCEATLKRDRAVFIYKYVEFEERSSSGQVTPRRGGHGSEIYLVMEQLHEEAYMTVFFEEHIDPLIETEVCMFENKLRVDAGFHADEVEFIGNSGARDAYMYAGIQ